MVAVLFPISDSEPKLEASALEELASLGITSVALLRDSSIAGLVLEGWAFDARDVERAARAAYGARSAHHTAPAPAPDLPHTNRRPGPRQTQAAATTYDTPVE